MQPTVPQYSFPPIAAKPYIFFNHVTNLDSGYFPYYTIKHAPIRPFPGEFQHSFHLYLAVHRSSFIDGTSCAHPQRFASHTKSSFHVWVSASWRIELTRNQKLMLRDHQERAIPAHSYASFFPLAGTAPWMYCTHIAPMMMLEAISVLELMPVVVAFRRDLIHHVERKAVRSGVSLT